MSVGSPAPRDENFVTVMVGVDPTSSRSNPTIVPVGADPVTNRLFVTAEVTSFLGLQIPKSDYVGATYPTSTTEVYTYKLGGSGGTTVGTLTVTYTDSTKDNLLNAELT